MILPLAALAMALSNPMMNRELDVCLDNQARLDEMTIQAFRTELMAILSASDRYAEVAPCREGSVRISLRSKPPAEETAALGAARRKEGRIVPELDLFVDAIAQVVDTRLPGVLGRAMARVATHEIAHYLYQAGVHTDGGLLMERLGPGHLLAADRSFFRLAPPRPQN